MSFAGNKSGYTWALLDQDGNPTEHRQFYDRVTGIIHATMGSSFSAAANWGHKVARDGLQDRLHVDSQAMWKYLYGKEMTPNQVRDARATEGIKAHDYFEVKALTARAKDVTVLPVPPLPHAPAIDNWWRDQEGLWEVLEAEQTVWSATHRFQGTMDLVRRDREFGNLELLDLKTHKPATMRKPARLDDLIQLAAYKLAYEEMGLGTVETTRVLVVGLDGRYFEDTRQVDPTAFLDLLAAYRKFGEVA